MTEAAASLQPNFRSDIPFFCCILLIKSKSLDPAHSHHEAEMIGTTYHK